MVCELYLNETVKVITISVHIHMTLSGMIPCEQMTLYTQKMPQITNIKICSKREQIFSSKPLISSYQPSSVTVFSEAVLLLVRQLVTILKWSFKCFT